MIKIKFIQVIAVLSLFVIEQTTGEKIDSKSSDVQRKNSTTSLDSLIQNQLNCTHDTKCRLKSRRKRYVAFPEGSSFSVAFCATVGFVGNPNFIYFSWAINWGLAYDLPNDTWILNERNRKVFPKQGERKSLLCYRFSWL